MKITEKKLRSIIRSVLKESSLNEMDRMDFYQHARQQQKEMEIDLEKSMTKDEWKDFNATQYKDAIEKSKKIAATGFLGSSGVSGASLTGVLVKLIPASLALIPTTLAISFFAICCLAIRALIEKLQDEATMSRASDVEKRQKEIDRLEALYQSYYKKTSQEERDFIADTYDLQSSRGSYHIDDSAATYKHGQRWLHMPKPKVDTDRLRRK